jgi:hypothetical protein
VCNARTNREAKNKVNISQEIEKIKKKVIFAHLLLNILVMPILHTLPPQLQERIFEKIFRIAEIAKLNKQEIAEYEDSLKRYRDLYNVQAQHTTSGQRSDKINIKNNDRGN